jgi:hypothetical protein
VDAWLAISEASAALAKVLGGGVGFGSEDVLNNPLVHDIT